MQCYGVVVYGVVYGSGVWCGVWCGVDRNSVIYPFVGKWVGYREIGGDLRENRLSW
jgi:hypothetical protein